MASTSNYTVPLIIVCSTWKVRFLNVLTRTWLSVWLSFQILCQKTTHLFWQKNIFLLLIWYQKSGESHSVFLRCSWITALFMPDYWLRACPDWLFLGWGGSGYNGSVKIEQRSYVSIDMLLSSSSKQLVAQSTTNLITRPLSASQVDEGQKPVWCQRDLLPLSCFSSQLIVWPLCTPQLISGSRKLAVAPERHRAACSFTAKAHCLSGILVCSPTDHHHSCCSGSLVKGGF